jgi:hypothetical protein
VIIRTKLIPAPYSGVTAWPFIFINRDADKTILPHEMVHYERMAWWTPVWWALYLLSPAFRLREEVLAYKISVANGLPIDRAAELLVGYQTGVTKADALHLLESPYELHPPTP